MHKRLVLWLIALSGVASLFAEPSEDRWWPAQTLPKVLVETSNQEDFPEPRLALQMMLQSVAGLAAKAVNNGQGNEMVWVNNENGDLENWFVRMLATHPEIEVHHALPPWELVDHFAQHGVIKGYILYRSGANESVNVATSLAGLLNGIIVDEKLEKDAQSHGLNLLLDVRDKTPLWCFQTYMSKFNRRMLCLQSPDKPNIRDLAIAQRAFTCYGNDEPTQAAMKWLEPLSPVLGDNGSDEFANTDLSSRHGCIQTATDWCINLPVLMAGTKKLHLPKIKSLDPRAIDWSDHRSAVCFVGTDGDNVQWFQGNFFTEGNSYWANSERGKIPFGWSCCFDQLAQLSPQAIEYALGTRTPNDSFIEWGGGYYYPDRFALDFTNRWELLARHARHTWNLMKETNTRIIGFNFSQLDSPDTRKACETFASQTDGLLAILAFQYSPYEAGAGKTFWVKDRAGIEVPVISARYSIWEHAGNRERAGTPAKVAREIRETVEKTSEVPRYDWVIAHAWSYFKQAPGNDESAEDMVQENAPDHDGVCGYLPVTWCAERLPRDIRVVSPEELVWRIRMKHNSSETKKLFGKFQ